MSKLIIDDHPLQVLPTLAVLIGLKEAIVIQQVHYLLNREGVKIEGVKYVKNKTYKFWESVFPFWSAKTVRRVFKSLEDRKLIVKTNSFNKFALDRSLSYGIDYSVLECLENTPKKSQNPRLGHFDPMHLPKRANGVVKMTQSSGQNDPMTSGQNDPMTSGQNDPMNNNVLLERLETTDDVIPPFLVEDLKKIGFSNADIESLKQMYPIEKISLEIERLYHAFRYPSFTCRSKTGWMLGSLATEGGYAIPEPERFFTRQEREAARQKKQEAEAIAKRVATEKAAAESAKKNLFDQLFADLGEAEQAEINEAALQAYKSKNNFGYTYYTGRKREGWNDSQIPVQSAELREVRNELLKEKYPEAFQTPGAPPAPETKPIGNLIAESLRDVGTI